MPKKKVVRFEITYRETEKGDFSIIIDGVEYKYKKKAGLKKDEHPFILAAAAIIDNMIQEVTNNKAQEKELIQFVLDRVKVLKDNRIK